jgi:YVTN family beta-propeller protein
MRQKLAKGRFVAIATALAIVATPLAALEGTAPAGATPSYTAFIVNDQYPASNSITEATGTGSSWTPGTPLVLGSGSLGLTTVAVSPDGSTAYVAEGGTDNIVPVATSTFTAGTAFSSGVSVPFYDAVTPNGNSLVVVGLTSGTVSVISTANTSSIQTVTVGSNPAGLAILPNSSAAYVSNQGSGTVSVVSLTGTPTVTKTIKFHHNGCTSPSYLAATPNGKYVYVTCSGTSKLWRIKVASNKARRRGITIPNGGNTGNGGLHQVAITPNGQTAYVASGNDVYPVELSNNHVGTGIAMTNAWSLSISTDGAYLLAGQSDNGCGCSTDNVESIKVSNNTVADTFSSGGYEHFSLAFQP